MIKAGTATAACAALALGACATPSNKVAATYVSPTQYERWDCGVIGEEMQRVSARAAEVAGVQDQAATGDAVAMGVALVVFWPALFLVEGGAATEAELGRLKGQMDALQQVASSKSCGFQVQQAPAG